MITDIKYYKIPNYLCFGAMVAGVIYSLFSQGINGAGLSLLGIIFPMVLLFGLYAGGVLGAGDIKLFASIGAFIHLDIWKVILLSLFVAVPVGIIAMCIGKKTQIEILSKRFKLTKMHFAIPVFIATTGYMIGGLFYGY